MRPALRNLSLAATLAASMLLASPGIAGNALREQGKPAMIADSTLTVTPSRDWNRLAYAPGKNTELWTLDGENLNDVTFFAGIELGKPLIREVSKKRKPLPKFTRQTLLVEVLSVVLKRWTHTASVARRQSTPEMVDILPKRADACQAGSAEASYHANRGPEDGERR